MDSLVERAPRQPEIGRVVGTVLTKEQFRVAEDHLDVSAERLRSVLHGELAAYVVRGFIDSEECQRINERFWRSPAIQPRYGDGDNGVEGFVLGSSHIEKTTAEYLANVERTNRHVAEVYDRLPDPISRVLSTISEIEGVGRVRPAEHAGRKAAQSKLVSWNQMGQFNLEPHDDRAQLSCPRQQGFEIQKVDKVVALNLYPSARTGEGQLKLWNVCPSVESRRSFGVEFSGFPYPADALEDIDSLTIDVATGDLCLISGNLVHAVLGWADALSSRRLLLTCFGGLLANGEFVVWT